MVLLPKMATTTSNDRVNPSWFGIASSDNASILHAKKSAKFDDIDLQVKPKIKVALVLQVLVGWFAG